MKRSIALLFVMIMLLSCVSCAKPTGAGGSDVSNSPETARDPFEDYNNRFRAHIPGAVPFDFFDDGDILFFGRKYLYKPTGECAYFCSKPECMHEELTCESYGMTLGIYDGRLYRTGSIDELRSGLFSMNLDGSDKRLCCELSIPDDDILPHSFGDFFLHRGKVYSLIHGGSTLKGDYVRLIRFVVIDPFTGETKVIMRDKSHPANAFTRYFVKENHIYIMIDYAPNGGADDFDGRHFWEILRYDVETETIEPYVTDDVYGMNRDLWMDEGGSFWALEWPEDDPDNYYDKREYILKLEDGHFIIKAEADIREGIWNSTVLSDGVAITHYANDFREDIDQVFRIWDYDGNTLVEGRPPIPELREEDTELVFDGYKPIWADKTSFWLYITFQRPIIKDGYPTMKPETFLLGYDISSGEFVLTFSEYDAE